MKLLILSTIFLFSSLSHASFEPPTNMVLVCVQNCKYGVPIKGTDNKWSVVAKDVVTFSYHIVTDSEKVVSFYGNPAPGNVNISNVRTATLNGENLFSTFFHDGFGNSTQIGTFNYYGEFEFYNSEDNCSMKLRPDLGNWYYAISCSNNTTKEFELSGIVVRTQRD